MLNQFINRDLLTDGWFNNLNQLEWRWIDANPSFSIETVRAVMEKNKNLLNSQIVFDKFNNFDPTALIDNVDELIDYVKNNDGWFKSIFKFL